MMAYSPAAVAKAFSRSWRPTLPGDSSWAATPDPTTTAARKALPSSSASRHLQSTGGFIGSSTARFGRSRTGTNRHSCLLAELGDAARTVPGDTGLGRRIGEPGIDLPGGTIGVYNPDLVLDREAAGGLILDLRRHPLPAQPISGHGHLVGSLHLDAEVAEGVLDAMSPALGLLNQDQLQRRVGDGEVGVSGLTLGRFGPEQLGVELDRRVDVGDIEGELDSGHQVPP